MQKTTLQCAICGKPAKVFVSMVTNWSLMKVYYCAKHAAESGIMDDNAYALIEQDTRVSRRVLSGLYCKRCGYTQKDLEKTGKFGCPNCYDAFNPILTGILEQTHQSTRHAGKIPRYNIEPKEVQNRILQLEIQMQEAVEKEDYERAAVLRDEINTLKGKNKPN